MASFGTGLLSLLLAGCDAGTATEPRPNVLLITIDTLRADHLGAYGYERGTSPALDELAERSFVFERAYSGSSWTLPSLATIMTSQYASTHRCVSNSAVLRDSFETLAERLAAADYATGAVTTHVFLGARYGLGQGIADYDDELVLETLQKSHRAVTSPEITAKGIDWLAGRAADPRPWFLWLHYFDPHGGYLVHEGLTDRFGRREPIDRYDGEIAFTDRSLRDVLGQLDALGLSEDTIVVVVADHGEEFGDHGGTGHRKTLYDEVLRVPLIVHVPGLDAGSYEEPVGTVDLLPTLLDLAGLAIPRGIEGRSLVPILEGGSLPPRPIIGELGGKRWEALLDGRWKLLRANEGQRTYLFDIESDPREQDDVAAQHPERVAAMAAELEAIRLRARRKGAELGRAEDERVRLSDEDLRALSELGYVDDGEDDGGTE